MKMIQDPQVAQSYNFLFKLERTITISKLLSQLNGVDYMKQTHKIILGC